MYLDHSLLTTARPTHKSHVSVRSAAINSVQGIVALVSVGSTVLLVWNPIAHDACMSAGSEEIHSCCKQLTLIRFASCNFHHSATGKINSI